MTEPSEVTRAIEAAAKYLCEEEYPELWEDVAEDIKEQYRDKAHQLFMAVTGIRVVADDQTGLCATGEGNIQRVHKVGE